MKKIPQFYSLLVLFVFMGNAVVPPGDTDPPPPLGSQPVDQEREGNDHPAQQYNGPEGEYGRMPTLLRSESEYEKIQFPAGEYGAAPSLDRNGNPIEYEQLPADREIIYGGLPGQKYGPLPPLYDRVPANYAFSEAPDGNPVLEHSYVDDKLLDELGQWRLRTDHMNQSNDPKERQRLREEVDAKQENIADLYGIRFKEPPTAEALQAMHEGVDRGNLNLSKVSSEKRAVITAYTDENVSPATLNANPANPIYSGEETNRDNLKTLLRPLEVFSIQWGNAVESMMNEDHFETLRWQTLAFNTQSSIQKATGLRFDRPPSPDEIESLRELTQSGRRENVEYHNIIVDAYFRTSVSEAPAREESREREEESK